MNDKNNQARAWWRDYELDEGQTGWWRIGPMQLFVQRRPSEWRVSWLSAGDPKDVAAEVELPSDREPPEDASSSRFTCARTHPRLSLSPRLADRPVVIKPETPLYVPGGEQVTLYVGSPVWVQIKVGDPPRDLIALPTHRATDTWAGPNTREGQICYGSRTLAQLRLEDCTIRPHRAITAVAVRNAASDPLLVEQLQLPAPLLALYATDDDVLWTQSVTLVRESWDQKARLEIGTESHPAGGVLRRLADARRQPEGNLVFQVFNRIFG
jgi:hypothetical protein